MQIVWQTTLPMPFVMSPKTLLAEVATRQLEGNPWVPRYCGSGRHELLVFMVLLPTLKEQTCLAGVDVVQNSQYYSVAD